MTSSEQFNTEFMTSPESTVMWVTTGGVRETHVLSDFTLFRPDIRGWAHAALPSTSPGNSKEKKVKRHSSQTQE